MLERRCITTAENSTACWAPICRPSQRWTKVYATRCFGYCDNVGRLNIVECRVPMWRVVRGPESTSYSLEHVLFLRVESSPLTNQRRGERGLLTPRSNKNSGLFDSNILFFRLPVLRPAQTKWTAARRKRVILGVGG